MLVTAGLADNVVVPQPALWLKPELKSSPLGPKRTRGPRGGKILAQLLQDGMRGTALSLADCPLHLEQQFGTDTIQLSLSIAHPLARQIVEFRARFWVCFEQKSRFAKVLPAEKAIGSATFPLLQTKLRATKRNLCFRP